MLTCKDAAQLLARDELDTSWTERAGLRLHLMLCRFCRRYRAQLRAMGQVCREQFRDAGEDPVALARLEQSILGQWPDSRRK